ncbi:MAG: LUD domain-containing protein [Imperialibacter sp.]
MSSREKILGNIRKLGLEPKPLPEIPAFEVSKDLEATFTTSLEANHVTVISCKNEKEVEVVIAEQTRAYQQVVTTLPDLYSSGIDLTTLKKPSDLRYVEAGIIAGAFGTAENGAIWVPESLAGLRALPFIVVHLIVVVERKTLVGNMHQAYKKIEEIPGFGVFIAGPSKTADIEQSLVIGAHGPKKMTVILC